MNRQGAPQSPAGRARRLFALQLEASLPALSEYLLACVRSQWPLGGSSPAGARADHRARLLAENLPEWVQGLSRELRRALDPGETSQGQQGGAAPRGRDAPHGAESLALRLTQAILGRASGQLDDLRARIRSLEQTQELHAQDVLNPEAVARIALRSWEAAGLPLDAWQDLQNGMHAAFSLYMEQSYHAANEWLVDHGVLAELGLQAPRDDALKPPRPGESMPGQPPGAGPEARQASGDGRTSLPAHSMPGAGAADVPWDDGTVTQHLSRYAGPSGAAPLPATPPQKLAGALDRLGALAAGPATGQQVETAYKATVMDSSLMMGPEASDATVVLPMRGTKPPPQAWHHAPATEEERTTLEVVALMFHGIMAEERIPAAMRVWFARLQIPVLRVALSEPELFASTDHPTRRLIDRMGACVLGFGRKGPAADEALEVEIKRIVQVVEAYPDSGRRVFQTVLGEFEKFLEGYFREQSETSRRALSLAQQLEQRETLAIQNTIEFRRLLEGEPVQDGVRQFLFDVWADVLATVSVSQGPSSDMTRAMKRVAGDLIWSAGAKVTREERADVLRRLPALLKAIREGMSTAGISGERQEQLIKKLNDSLTEGLTAKAAPLPQRKLEDLMEQLESLEEMLPEGVQFDIDESLVRDIPGASDTELRVVSTGGGEPIAAMLSWARELPTGSWYLLKHDDAERPVQLVWQGSRRLLALFVSAEGKCLLFQLRRLAAYLQGGLLQPAHDDDLAIKGVRGSLDILGLLPKPPMP